MIRPKLFAALLMVSAFTLTGCAAESAPEPDQDTTTETVEEAETVESEDTYIVRLTPVAKMKDAVSIEVDGLDGRVELPVASADANIMDCLNLLPARSGEGETLTLIYSDGVEEVCEWE